jgi:hypothetical protein
LVSTSQVDSKIMPDLLRILQQLTKLARLNS